MIRPIILTTQRVDYFPDIYEYREAVDVRLSLLLYRFGFLPVSVSHIVSEVDSALEQLNPSGIILSGGNSIGDCTERDNFEMALIQLACKKHIPTLGICRGMQLINIAFGGSLTDIDGHVKVRHDICGRMTNDLPIKVNSYHHQGIFDRDLARDFIVLARSNEGIVESFSHLEFPLKGIMWHPERDAPCADFDETFIKEFFLK